MAIDTFHVATINLSKMSEDAIDALRDELEGIPDAHIWEDDEGTLVQVTLGTEDMPRITFQNMVIKSLQSAATTVDDTFVCGFDLQYAVSPDA